MGLEVVVRPIVLPNIRPSAPQVMAPPDDPTQGLCVISGGSGKFIGTSISSSASTSKQTPSHETKRQVDVERVYQMDESGVINLNNFIDVERIKKVKAEPVMETGEHSPNDIVPDPASYQNIEYAQPEEKPNVKILETDKTIDSGTG